jgi:flagellar hook assembly protein FlgD
MKLSLALIAILAIPAFADSPHQVKSAIQGQMAGYILALKARDEKKVEAVIRANFAPEFKDVGLRGRTMDLEQTIKQMKSNISTLKSVQGATLVVAKVTVAGSKATTSELFTLSAQLQDPNDSKKTHTLKVDSAWTGTYVKRSGRWWCVRSVTTRENVLLDGKKAN